MGENQSLQTLPDKRSVERDSRDMDLNPDTKKLQSVTALISNVGYLQILVNGHGFPLNWEADTVFSRSLGLRAPAACLLATPLSCPGIQGEILACQCLLISLLAWEALTMEQLEQVCF